MRDGPADLDMPGNGERALTHSERKWLLEQMASRRKRPAGPARLPAVSEDSEPRHGSDAGSRAPAVGPPLVESTRDAPREKLPGSPLPPSRANSFWSFG